MPVSLNTADPLYASLSHLFVVDDDNVVKELRTGLAVTPHASVLLPNTGSTSAPLGRSWRTGGTSVAAPAVYGLDFADYGVSNTGDVSVFITVNGYNGAYAAINYAACAEGADSAGLKVGTGWMLDPATGRATVHNNNGAFALSSLTFTTSDLRAAGVRSFGFTRTAAGVVKFFVNGAVDDSFAGGLANTGSRFGGAWATALCGRIGGYTANSWVGFDYVVRADWIGTVLTEADFLRLHNSAAGANSFALLDVPAPPSPPTITTQPTDQTVSVGSAATFAVEAGGTGLAYQWQRNIVDISGATAASHTTPAAALSGGAANAGDTYRCVVTNGGGSVTSASATLNVTAAPATAITLAGPSGGQVGVASAAITVGANGAVSGSHTVTLSDGGGGGAFTPATITLTAGEPTGTVTYTPSSAGAKTISATDAGGYAAPASLTYTASSTAGVFTSEPLKDNTGTLIASQALVHYTLYDDITGLLVVRKTGLSTNASGVVSFADGAIASGTAYRSDWRSTAGHYRMPAKAAT